MLVDAVRVYLIVSYLRYPEVVVPVATIVTSLILIGMEIGVTENVALEKYVEAINAVMPTTKTTVRMMNNHDMRIFFRGLLSSILRCDENPICGVVLTLAEAPSSASDFDAEVCLDFKKVLSTGTSRIDLRSVLMTSSILRGIV